MRQDILLAVNVICFVTYCSDLNPLGVQSGPDTAAMSVGLALGLCITAFIVGLLLMGLFCYVYVRRRRPRIPGSPHYISSKQNSYVTVPLKDSGSHHTKRALSFSSASSSNGSTLGSQRTLGSQKTPNGATVTPKLFTKPHAEYETATIKRNSHSLNGNIRADLDQDRFF